MASEVSSETQEKIQAALLAKDVAAQAEIDRALKAQALSDAQTADSAAANAVAQAHSDSATKAHAALESLAADFGVSLTSG